MFISSVLPVVVMHYEICRWNLFWNIFISQHEWTYGNHRKNISKYSNIRVNSQRMRLMRTRIGMYAVIDIACTADTSATPKTFGKLRELATCIFSDNSGDLLLFLFFSWKAREIMPDVLKYKISFSKQEALLFYSNLKQFVPIIIPYSITNVTFIAYRIMN